MPLSTEQLSSIRSFAENETEQYGLPTRFHLDLSVQKAGEIADALGADRVLAMAATYLIDVKLGQAFKDGRQPEHVKMGVAATTTLSAQLGVDAETTALLVNAVAAHHGGVKFESVESEIAANADCYRFVHPAGVVHYITTLTKRGLPFDKIVATVNAKFEEKATILSLPYCRKELSGYIESLRGLLVAAANGEPKLTSQ